MHKSPAFTPYTLHPTPKKSLQIAIFLAQSKIIHYLCTQKGLKLRFICRKRAAEPYHDIDKIAFAIYSLTYLET